VFRDCSRDKLHLHVINHPGWVEPTLYLNWRQLLVNTPIVPQSPRSNDDNVDSAARKGRNRPERVEYRKFIDSLPPERQAVHLQVILTWLCHMAAKKNGQTNSAAPLALEGGAE
jgi:hypothetical protein